MTRIEVRERAGWRRPISAHAEETVLGLGLPGERRINWQLVGPHQVEDAWRLMNGEACTECLAVFPAAPSLRNLSRFREIAHEYSAARGRDEVLRLVSQERCPSCGAAVTPELAALQYVGPHEGARIL